MDITLQLVFFGDLFLAHTPSILATFYGNVLFSIDIIPIMQLFR